MAYTTDSLQFLERATETLRAAAHPIRLSLIGLLAEEGPQTVKHIHETLDIQQPVETPDDIIDKARLWFYGDEKDDRTYYSLLLHFDFLVIFLLHYLHYLLIGKHSLLCT